MSRYPTLGRKPLWALVRLVAWLIGAVIAFGLLMLASLWFAIPFALAVVATAIVGFEVTTRARFGWMLVQRWTRRTL